MSEKEPDHAVAKNRKAWHDYEILQRFEAGIVLQGTEVKAVRAGHVGISDAWAGFDEHGELCVQNITIGAYKNAGYAAHDERRKRKLLLRKVELRKLKRQIEEKSNTIIPLRIYFKGAYLKVEIAVARGRREYDKRAQKEKAFMQRELKRELKNRR
jgi:SsrA-binding protein